MFPRALADGLNPNIDAALQAIAVIEAAAPRVVIPGHGAPFTGTEITAAIAVARKRLHSFAADPAKNARHVIKVMFVFALLHRQSLSLADLPAYINTVPCYRDLNQFLTSPQNDISTWLVEDLLKAGAINLEAGTIRPTMPA